MTCQLDIGVAPGVAAIVLDEPATRNAFSSELAHDLLDALDAIESDERVGAVVLAAEGPAFCVGGDVALFAREIAEGSLVQRVAGDVSRFNPFVHRLATCPKPVVAALHGAVAGGGLALAAACDLRVATSDAIFVPGFIGVGLPPDTGSSWLITRLVGAGRAADFLMRNRRLDAQTALAWGLVNEIVDAPRARAIELAAELASGPRRAMADTKKLLADAGHCTFQQQLDAESAAVVRAIVGHEIVEGVTAFMEKRPPRF
ncbi:MAG: enoyl-CoA hydratase-related protein [Acidimicrobiales bacterium]|nr:enoyl-CoA hydratase-related protein [Acidimicrobiales bacterium]